MLAYFRTANGQHQTEPKEYPALPRIGERVHIEATDGFGLNRRVESLTWHLQREEPVVSIILSNS